MRDGFVLTPALRLSEVARLLGVGRSTAHRLVVSGEIQGFRVGATWRALRADLDAFVLARRVTAGNPYLDALRPSRSRL